MKQSTVKNRCLNLSRSDSAEQAGEEIAGIAQGWSRAIDNGEGGGQALFEEAAMEMGEGKADVAGCHGEDSGGRRIDGVSVLRFGYTVSEVEFREEVWAVEEPVIGSEEERNIGFEEIADGRKGQAEGCVGAGIDHGDGTGIFEQVDFACIGDG